MDGQRPWRGGGYHRLMLLRRKPQKLVRLFTRRAQCLAQHTDFESSHGRGCNFWTKRLGSPSVELSGSTTTLRAYSEVFVFRTSAQTELGPVARTNVFEASHASGEENWPLLLSRAPRFLRRPRRRGNTLEKKMNDFPDEGPHRLGRHRTFYNTKCLPTIPGSSQDDEARQP